MAGWVGVSFLRVKAKRHALECGVNESGEWTRTVVESRVSAEERVERLYREERFQLPPRHQKRLRLYDKTFSVIRLRPNYPHHI